MLLIGLVGKMQSGKTTISQYLNGHYKLLNPSIPVIKIAFGDLLKHMILQSGLCTKEELWGVKTEFSRLMLQKIGTEIIRKQVDENFWVNKMRDVLNDLKVQSPTCIVIIDDVRFINEASLIQEFGGKLIRINRPSLEQNKVENQHLSETEQDNIDVNFTIINDGSIREFENKMDDVLKTI